MYDSIVPFAEDIKANSAIKKVSKARKIPLAMIIEVFVFLPALRLNEAATRIRKHIIIGLLISLYK